jgi:hypothetical protein
MTPGTRVTVAEANRAATMVHMFAVKVCEAASEIR